MRRLASPAALVIAAALIGGCYGTPGGSGSPAGSPGPVVGTPTATNPAPTVEGSVEATPSPSPLAFVGCPPKPWTLASILAVPDGGVDGIWSPAAAHRAKCFGSQSIRVTAQVWAPTAWGMVGVDSRTMGRAVTILENTGTSPLGAWLALDASMSGATRLALGRTGADGGLGLEAWFDLSGHFVDSAAQGCLPTVGDAIDDRPISYTPAEAIAFCEDQFVIEALTWVQPKPSPAATLPVAPGSPGPPTDFVGGGTFPGVCPGESTIRERAPCVAVAVAWTPAPGPMALFRIYESWTGPGSGATCSTSGSLVYTTGVGASYASFVLQPASSGSGRRCLAMEAANTAGASSRELVPGDFTEP